MEEKSFLNESLKVMSSCPICQGKYNDASVMLVERKDDSYFLHITCPVCASTVLAYVMPSGVGLTTVALLTDMKRNEIQKFISLETVQNDDLLEFYKLVANDSKEFTSRILNN